MAWRALLIMMLLLPVYIAGVGCGRKGSPVPPERGQMTTGIAVDTSIPTMIHLTRASDGQP